MTERIIYCVVNCIAILAEYPHEQLMPLDGGSVVSVSDVTFQKIVAREPSIPVLYFSKTAFTQAVKDLSIPEKEEVIRKRLKEWSPQALNHALYWTYLLERQCLTLTALAKSEIDQNAVKTLDTHFEQTLTLLTKINYEGLYDNLELRQILEVILEGESRLINELTEAGGAEQEIDTRRKFASSLGAEMNKRYHEDYGQGLPHVNLTRAVFVSPSDPNLKDLIIKSREPFLEWRDGLVVTWQKRRFGIFQKQGKSVLPLYLNQGEFVQDLAELTSAQLKVKFRNRLESDNASRKKSLYDHINSLRLEQVLQCRVALARSIKEDPALVGVLKAHIQKDSSILMSEVAKHTSWLPKGEDSKDGVLIRLRTCEENIAGDATFFETFCHYKNLSDLEPEIKNLILTKASDLSRINSLMGKTK